MYYIRKIDQCLWKDKCALDAVSISDLSTKDNDISVWIDDDTPNEHIRLALAFILQTPKICDLFILRIPDSEIKAKGLNFNKVPSGTPYVPKRGLHTNICVPTLYELGDLADIMHTLVEQNQMVYVSEQELKEAFYQAVKNNEIEIDFNDKRYRPFRKPLREMELQYKSPIDFNVSDKAKEVIPDTRKTCPICKGQGKISPEKFKEITTKSK